MQRLLYGKQMLDESLMAHMLASLLYNSLKMPVDKVSHDTSKALYGQHLHGKDVDKLRGH